MTLFWIVLGAVLGACALLMLVAGLRLPRGTGANSPHGPPPSPSSG